MQHFFHISSLDVEGWHHRLNRKTSNKKGFYEIVVKVLFKEVKKMENRLKMVSENKLTRRQKTGMKTVQGKVFKMWQEYEDGYLSVNSLLNRVKDVYAP